MPNGTAPATQGGPTRLAPIAAVRPGWAEMALLLTASLITLVGVTMGADVPQWINWVAPTMLAAAVGYGAVDLVRRDSSGIWAPLFWVRIVTLAYSGIGSLVPLFANDVTRATFDRFFTVYPVDMTKYNAVICVFTLVVLLSARVTCAVVDLNVRRRPGPIFKVEPSALDSGQFSLFALAAAVAIKLPGAWIPFVTGISSPFPNIILIVGMLSYVAYPLLIYHGLRNRLRWPFMVAIPFIFLESALGFLMFNKTELLFPLIFAALGAFFHRPTLARVLISAAIILAAYSFATPFVAYGRSQEARDTGSINTTLPRAIEIASEYTTERGEAQLGDYQSGWARLAYMNGGSFAISQYDQGVPGRTMDNILLILVPRALYPDKPNMTEIFADFNYAVTGNDKSQSSPGIPAEVYWNYGWWGVCGFALIMGMTYALWSIYTVVTLKAGAWHLLFVSLLGIRAASRIDGLIVTDFIPMIPLAIGAHFALTLANHLLIVRNARRVGGGAHLASIPAGPAR